MTSRRKLLQSLALTAITPALTEAAVPEIWPQTIEFSVLAG